MELVLHIGAHRTGTTALQRMLAANRPALSERGIVALIHDELGALPGFAKLSKAASDPAPVRAAIEAATQGARQVILSEENLIGDMGWNIRAGKFYPRARPRLAGYARAFAVAPRRVGLAIRSYARYWISAHAIELAYRNAAKRGIVRFADARDGMANARRGWLDLVDDLRAVFPETEILVWPVEEKHPVEALAARLLGAPDLDLVPPPAAVNAAPGDAFIPVMEALRSARPAMRRADLEAALTTATPEPFAGFAPAQKAALDARYAADLAALKAGHGDVRFLDAKAAA